MHTHNYIGNNYISIISNPELTDILIKIVFDFLFCDCTNS